MRQVDRPDAGLVTPIGRKVEPAPAPPPPAPKREALPLDVSDLGMILRDGMVRPPKVKP